MKNILLPIDFSTTSHNAGEYAVSLALAFDATLILINAIPPPFVIDDMAAASLLVSQTELREENQSLLMKEIKALSKKPGLKIEGLVREGFVSDTILEIAREKHADIIVMGGKGKGRSNSIFGSTTISIMRQSWLPVLVVPENASYKPMDTITIASDFDAETEMGHYAFLLKLAEKFNSFIQILNVQKNESAMSSENVIGKTETNLIFTKFKHSFHSVKGSNVEEGINTFIEKNSTGILVMMAHKHSIFERMFGKIHTKSMSYQTKIPLLVLHGK